jgi:hypothetical protein
MRAHLNRKTRMEKRKAAFKTKLIPFSMQKRKKKERERERGHSSFFLFLHRKTGKDYQNRTMRRRRRRRESEMRTARKEKHNPTAIMEKPKEQQENGAKAMVSFCTQEMEGNLPARGKSREKEGKARRRRQVESSGAEGEEEEFAAGIRPRRNRELSLCLVSLFLSL